MSPAAGAEREGPGERAPDLGAGQEAEQDQRGQRQPQELAQPLGQAFQRVSRTLNSKIVTPLLFRASGMDDFPIWVQCLPKVLFNVIVAREESEFITKEALKTFYEKFGGLTGSELERTAEQGFNTATDVTLKTFRY